MLLDWFSTKEVEKFATDLATEFSQRFPVAEISASSPQAASRQRGAKDLMMSRAQVFAERHKLNLLKRAKLANTLKWKLRELGYDPAVSEPLVYEVVRIVTLIRSKR